MIIVEIYLKELEINRLEYFILNNSFIIYIISILVFEMEHGQCDISNDSEVEKQLKLM